MKRDKNGCLILDELKVVNNFLEGRKPKLWLTDGENLFLFKMGAMNYENYAELIASEIAKQCGIETALYDLATYKGVIGVVTPNFLKKNDVIISGEEILNDGAKIAQRNNLNIKIENTLESIVTSLNLRYAFTNIDEFINSLICMWCFDLLISESDRNRNNWSIISNSSGIKLAPIYDCSTMAFLNNDISSYMTGAHSYSTLLNLLDSLKLGLHYRSDLKNSTILSEFAILCQENIEYVERIMRKIMEVDVRKAIISIEERHNINKQGTEEFKIPNIVSFWVEKLVELRKKDMINIFYQEKEKIKSKKR